MTGSVGTWCHRLSRRCCVEHRWLQSRAVCSGRCCVTVMRSALVVALTVAVGQCMRWLLSPTDAVSDSTVRRADSLIV